MSSAINLVYRHLPPVDPPEDPREGVCCVTGDQTMTIGRRCAIKPSFTNFDMLRAPTSDRVGIPAWRCLTYSETNPSKKRERAPLRQSSWACLDDGIYWLNRQGVRDHVLNPFDSQSMAGYATTSYKKHGILAAPSCSGGRRIWLFETILVDCSDHDQVREYWETMREAQDNGIPRPLIEQLDILPAYIAKIGIHRWREFEAWARPKIRSPLYQFLTYLLPSKDELAAMNPPKEEIKNASSNPAPDRSETKNNGPTSQRLPGFDSC